MKYLLLALAIVTGLGHLQAQAQTYPSAPVHIVVPAAAGGNTDLVARLFAEFLTSRLRQPMIVDNKPGADTLIGNQFVARAAPDGYTLLFATSNASFAVAAKNPGIDVASELDFISPVVRGALVLAVNASRPVKSIADLTAYSRANPGELNFASFGKASWLYTEMLNSRGGITAVNIPFGGLPQAVQALASGEVDYALATPQLLKASLDAGKVRMLAVMLKNRSDYVPGLPGLAESGLDIDDLITWFGLLAPKGTPRAIIQLLNGEVAEFLKQPSAVARLEVLGLEPFATTPEAFREIFLREEKALKDTAAALGVEPQ